MALAVEIHFEDRSTGSPLPIFETVEIPGPVSHDQDAVRRMPSQARDSAFEDDGNEPCTGLEVPTPPPSHRRSRETMHSSGNTMPNSEN